MLLRYRREKLAKAPPPKNPPKKRTIRFGIGKKPVETVDEQKAKKPKLPSTSQELLDTIEIFNEIHIDQKNKLPATDPSHRKEFLENFHSMVIAAVKNIKNIQNSPDPLTKKRGRPQSSPQPLMDEITRKYFQENKKLPTAKTLSFITKYFINHNIEHPSINSAIDKINKSSPDTEKETPWTCSERTANNFLAEIKMDKNWERQFRK